MVLAAAEGIITARDQTLLAEHVSTNTLSTTFYYAKIKKYLKIAQSHNFLDHINNQLYNRYYYRLLVTVGKLADLPVFRPTSLE